MDGINRNHWIVSSECAFIDNKEKKYILIGKIDNEDEFSTYLEDVDIIAYRIENLFVNSENSIVPLKDKINSYEIKSTKPTHGSELVWRDREHSSLSSQLSHVLARIDKIAEVGVGFIINCELDAVEFMKKVDELLSHQKRYFYSFSSHDELTIGSVSIDIRPRQ